MPRNILIIPDKFKGTMTARQAAVAIARGWRQARPTDRLELLPMSDGGDGFGAILGSVLGATTRYVTVPDAAGRLRRVPWWFHPSRRVAIVESARVIGLAMLPPGRFHPFELDTRGLGHLLQRVTRSGAQTCLIGIGGSATNDGGFGLARAWGWQFLDAEGHHIPSWPELVRLRRLIPPPALATPLRLIVARDVENPLLGPQGASRVYGPQKGLRPRDLPNAEAALRRLARVVRDHAGIDYAAKPGAGAAGGLGFGLMAFLGGRSEPGFDLFAKYADLEHRLGWAQLVITGEGTVDRSSIMGKGVGEVARRCRHRRLPCVVLAGVVRGAIPWRRHFTHVATLTDLVPQAQAIARPAYWLTRLAKKIALFRPLR